MHDGNLAAQEVAAECQGDTLTCTNSGCRNPKGSVLPRECFMAEAHGRTITYRTCSFCRVKDSLKKRQHRAATIQNKDTLRVLECQLAELTKEHQRLKEENLRLRAASNGIAEGRPRIVKQLDSLMLTDTDLNAELKVRRSGARMICTALYLVQHPLVMGSQSLCTTPVLAIL